MPAEPPPKPSADPPTPAAPAAVRPSAREIAEAERRIDSPNRLTLRLLGVVFLATVLPWIGAKTACNLRDSPIRQPHDLPTEVLAKNAKSAALELSQRAASGRYLEAAELARGDVPQELLEADRRCQAEPAPCQRRRERAERVFTRAVVASRGPYEANVRTESRVADDPPERFAMYLQQEDGRWFVTKRAPLEGDIDAPVRPEEVVSPVAIRQVPGHGNMSLPPGDHAHGAAPHGSAPSNGAPSGTNAPR